MIKLHHKISIEKVLSRIRWKSKENGKREFMCGTSVNVTSVRLNVFKEKGTNCVTCGIRGRFFRLEKHHESDKFYHLALYAINDYGHEILMTKDHTTPLSKNGSNILFNLRPMCSVCNVAKGDQIL